MATNSVNDYLVCRYLQSGNWVGQFPYGQGAAVAVVNEEDGSGGGGDKKRRRRRKLKKDKRVFLPSFLRLFFFINSVLYAPLGSKILSSLPL
jgi:hypothetical protein